MMSKPKGATEAQWAKALSHPLRARILQVLGERVASPNDLAVELKAPLGVVSYHVRMLRDYGMIELARTEPKRGALQHYYRAKPRRRGRKGRDLNLLRTQLAALFGVPERAITVGVSTDEDGTRYQVEAVGCSS
jgi:DNA-binding transcriptional ArsR family regulator